MVQLKILACNIAGGRLDGALYVNGQPCIKRDLRQRSTIVWQRDLLLPTATVGLSGCSGRGASWQ